MGFPTNKNCIGQNIVSHDKTYAVSVIRLSENRQSPTDSVTLPWIFLCICHNILNVAQKSVEKRKAHARAPLILQREILPKKLHIIGIFADRLFGARRYVIFN